MHSLPEFLLIALLVTLTPGPGTATIVRIAYDALRLGGAAVLIVLGLRSLLRRGSEPAGIDPVAPRRSASWRTGLITGLANPKLAVFFVALFPQFLSRDAPVLPLALAMAASIVALDLAWYSTLAYAIDRSRAILRDQVQRRLERLAGAIMVAFGIRLFTESR